MKMSQIIPPPLCHHWIGAVIIMVGLASWPPLNIESVIRPCMCHLLHCIYKQT